MEEKRYTDSPTEEEVIRVEKRCETCDGMGIVSSHGPHWPLLLLRFGDSSITCPECKGRGKK